MKFYSILLTLLFVSLPSIYGKINYKNHKVFRVSVKNDNENTVEILKKIHKNGKDFDVWGSVDKQSLDVMVAPELLLEFNERIKGLDLNAEIFISDVQKLIDNERAKKRSLDFGWDDYRTLEEINEWLYNLTETYPENVQLINGGVSYEGRNITGVHVSFSPNNQNNSVFIEGNIHAREWITSAVVTFILNELLTSNDPAVRTVAESHDWYIFPVVNPDGFVYTHTTERLWRKTRTPYGDDCYGVDANRNWDYHFNEGGTSDDPCDNMYLGPYAFSESCTKTLSEYIRTVAPQLQAYISFHSYSQYLLIPYGFTSEHLDNYDELYQVGLKAIESLAERYGTNYTVGTFNEVLYLGSGISTDWVKGRFNIPIVYTYELRDTGFYGFVLPPEQIIPCAEETLDSVITIFEEFAEIN